MTKKRLAFVLPATPWILLAVLAPANAQQGVPTAGFIPPCVSQPWWVETATRFDDFDFWVGSWQVYDTESDELVGLDRVEKVFEGCSLRQHWQQLDDRFALPDSPWRLEGGSFTAIGADGRWYQTWLDNSGSFLPLAGGLDAEGVMVLESEWLSYRSRAGEAVQMRFRLHWAPREDGTIHNWGLVAQSTPSEGEPQEIPWKKYFDIVYRRNVPHGPAARLEETAEP